MCYSLQSLRSDLANIVIVFVWLTVNVAVFARDYIKYLTAIEFHYFRLLVGFNGHWLALARASALAIKLNSALVLIPICRNCLSLLRTCFGHCPEPFGRSTRRLLDNHVIHHKWIARVIIFYTFLHLLAHTFNVEQLCQAWNDGEKRRKSSVPLATLSQFPEWAKGNENSDNYVNPIRNESTSPYVVLFTTKAGVTGVVITTALILIWTSASRVVRLYAFEVFWFTHHLFVVFFVGLGYHGTGGFVRRQINVEEHDPIVCQDRIKVWVENDDDALGNDGVKCPKPQFGPSPPTAYLWIVGPIALYVVERVVKFMRTRHPYRITKIVCHPSNVLELRMEPTVGSRRPVEPGQYIALQVPALSRLEWHPFTLTSAPDDDHISVHIRSVGDWTKGIAKLCQRQEPGASSTACAPVELSQAPIVYVDGPFGAASEEWFAYETAVFIGAGIGVTPFASVLKHVAHQGNLKRSMMYVRKIHFYWVTPDMKAFEWFRELLHSLETTSGDGGRGENLLSYHIFLTRGWDPQKVKSIARRGQDCVYDEFSNLHHKTEFGRPNWKVELTKIVDPLAPNSRVGVFLCGPKPLAHELKEACNSVNETTDDGTRLYFNKEHF